MKTDSQELAIAGLVRAHYERNDKEFERIIDHVLSEAKTSSPQLVAQINQLMARVNSGLPLSSDDIKIPQDAQAFFQAKSTHDTLADMALDSATSRGLSRVLLAHANKAKLLMYGLTPARRLLFHGPPGTGKTMAAAVMAKELGLPMFTVNTEAMIDSHLGGTGQNLKKVFSFISTTNAVFLIDEFDSIATSRQDTSSGSGGDVKEMKRVLTSLLVFMESHEPRGLLVCATNLPEVLDGAVMRRFDDIVMFSQPSIQDKLRLIQKVMNLFPSDMCEAGFFSQQPLSPLKLDHIAATPSHALVKLYAQRYAQHVVINDRIVSWSAINKAFGVYNEGNSFEG